MSTKGKRESLRGVGRDAAGPHPFTHRIHALVLAHPEGMTRDEIVAEVVAQGWIGSGYASRWYQRRLESQRRINRRKGYDGGDAAAPSYGTPEFTERAITAKARAQLFDMVKSGSLRRNGDRFLAIDRKLKSTEGITREQIVFSRDEGRKAIAEMELIRALRPYRDNLTNSQLKLPLADRRKLLTWLNAADNFAPKDTST